MSANRAADMPTASCEAYMPMHPMADAVMAFFHEVGHMFHIAQQFTAKCAQLACCVIAMGEPGAGVVVKKMVVSAVIAATLSQTCFGIVFFVSVHVV